MILLPHKTLVVCFEHGHAITQTARAWLSQRFAATIADAVCIAESPYICARNLAVRDVVLPRAGQFDFALFIDNDVTPTHPGTDAFLRLDADVAACECRMPLPGAWDRPDAFHTPLWWCRMEVLRRIEAPWFLFAYGPDGCSLRECDCRYFARKVLAAGFSIAHGGHCGHHAEGQWHGCG